MYDEQNELIMTETASQLVSDPTGLAGGVPLLAGGWQAGGWLIGIAYFSALLIACVFGVHRYWLVVRYYRTKRRGSAAPVMTNDLPHVTVQLPMFNESAVAERVIDAACRIDYPRDKLQIQVLDDSTDACAEITRACVERWQARGIDIEHLHRSDRTGFKAGALQAGLERATGAFIAVFDADFVPPPNYLRAIVPHFDDDSVGMVQAAWDHLNRDDSILTACQAVYLDSHFQIEHPARHRDARWFNFNGTAGIWRRTAIETAGGWQHDTLTEDMDLSYRAQLAGWRFVYLPDLHCPAELPPSMDAFKTQQHRWTKGTVQTARKLLPTILRADAPLGCRIEAAFHLTSPIVYPCVILIALLMMPTAHLSLKPLADGSISAAMLGLMILMLATASGVTFYAAGQFERRMGLLRTIAIIPPLVAIGVGMSVNNALAALEAALGRTSAFVRTPKFNRTPRSPRVRGRQRLSRRERWSVIIELSLGLYLIGCLGWAIRIEGGLWLAPFLLLFAVGFLTVGLSSLPIPAWLRRRSTVSAMSTECERTA